MDFLTNLLLYGLAFLGVIVLIGSLIAAAVLALQERFGYLSGGSSFDRASEATDRLHAEAQQAIRDLQSLDNRRGF